MAALIALAIGAMLVPPGGTPDAHAQSVITYSLDSNLYNVREGDNLRMKVRFSAPLPSDQTLETTYVFAGQTAEAADVAATQGTNYTVPAGATEYDIHVLINQDNVIEPKERFYFSLSDSSAVIAPGSPSGATVNIFNVTVVPDDWALLPSGVNPGQQFRLLFVTDAYSQATTTNLNAYGDFVRNRVTNHGHADIRAHASGFEVVGSTPSVDAHVQTGTGSDVRTQWNTPIYWLNGSKIAGYHGDFWDGSWEAQAEADARAADGLAPSTPGKWTWTGTQNGGTKSSDPLGSSGDVTYGDLGTGTNPIAQGTSGRGGVEAFYGISQIFQREGTPRAQRPSGPQEVFFATASHHVTEGDAVRVTLRLRYAELTPINVELSTNNPSSSTLARALSANVISEKTEPADSGDYEGFTDRQFTIPAGHTSYSFEIPTVKDDLDEERMQTFRIHPGVTDVTFGQPSAAFVHISDMPKVVLSRENIEATEASSCADSVGSHGDVFRSEQYTIKLDRSPGPGKFVSVEIWEPSDMVIRDGFDRFLHYSEIFGTPQWPLDMGGRVSIENTPVLRQYQGFTRFWDRYESTILLFFESDWDNAKTVTVRMHCASHGSGALPIYHFAFRHHVPVGIFDSRSFIRGHWLNGKGTRTAASKQSQRFDWKPRSDDSRANTTHKIAWVKVTDRNQSPAPTTSGNLAFDLTSPMFGSVSGGRYFETFATEWLWKNDPLQKNDYDDAARHFSGFRVRVRTEGHPDQEIYKPVHQIVNRLVSGWYYGGFHALGSVTGGQQPPRAFEFSVVPVDKNGDNVEAERVTICRDFKKRANGWGYLDLNSHPDCPPAPPTPMNSPGGGQGSPPSNPGPGQGGTVSGGSGQALPSPVGPPEAHTVSDITLTSMKVTWRDRDNVGTYLVVWVDSSGSGNEQTTLVFDNEYTITGLKADTEYIVAVFSSDYDQISIIGRHRTLALDHTTDLEEHYAELIKNIKGWRDNFQSSTQASYRRPFNRALLAFGVTDFTNSNARYQRLDQADALLAPMTAAEAQAILDSKTEPWDLSYWGQITSALTEIEAIPPAPAGSDPVISISAGNAVTEGADATFTVTATPAPTADLDVSVTVSQSGDFATTGTQTVTIPTTGSVTLTVSTIDDSKHEPDGSVTATVDDGTGYAVSSTDGAATVDVSDNDPAPSDGNAAAVVNGSITLDVPDSWTGRGKPQVTGGAHRLAGWSGLGFDFQGLGSPPGTITVSWSSRPAGNVNLPLEWQPVAGSGWQWSDGGPIGLTTVEITDPPPAQPQPEPEPEVTPQPEPQPQPDPEPAPVVIPEVSISGGTAVNEGNDATFTVTATPAPTAALTVSVTVSQAGDFASTGTQTVTVPTTGSVIFTVSTTNDSTDEPDGSVTVTVDSGNGYTVSSSNGAATVAVTDNDVPELSISAGGDVTEGSDASFTVTANPAPHSALTVLVAITQSGDFGSPGTQTVTIPTSGSVTFTVSTTDDSKDEPDGSVTARLSSGSGYTVSSANGAATVSVSDDDDPPPASPGGPGVTIADATASEGDSHIRFTVRLDTARVNTIVLGYFAISQSASAGSDFGFSGGNVMIPAGQTSVVIEVPIIDDSIGEGDETLQMMIYSHPFRDTIPNLSIRATGTITDND